MIRATTGKPGQGMTFRPSASQESAPRPLRAPRAVKAQGATQSRPNWAQMALDLPQRPQGVA